MRSPTDIAWAAGLFEGEGCIEVTLPAGYRDAVRLTVVSTDRDVLEKLLAVAGCGSIRPLGAPSLRKPGWKQTYSWRVGSVADVEELLQEWLPYLGARRSARAQEALEACARITRRMAESGRPARRGGRSAAVAA